LQSCVVQRRRESAVLLDGGCGHFGGDDEFAGGGATETLKDVGRRGSRGFCVRHEGHVVVRRRIAVGRTPQRFCKSSHCSAPDPKNENRCGASADAIAAPASSPPAVAIPRSRHTSSTTSGPTGRCLRANPLMSALSQITLTTRGMPPEAR